MDDLTEEQSYDSINSVLRERIVEHIFVGEVLRRLWLLRVTDVEVLRSEFDAGGYDLVLSYRHVVRHIQLKVSGVAGRTTEQKVSRKLAEKPSGCVIWILVTPDLELHSYRWFGGAPGEPLPNIGDLRVAKHTKPNADGIKLERPNHRVLPKGRFEKLDTCDALLERLFGPLNGA